MATANLGRVGFVNKGTYSGATTYKVNDVIVYNGGTYACIQANTGQAPTNTSYWQNWVANDKALDSAVVHKTGNETIVGVKTFSSSPIVPTPTTGTQAVNKDYADLKLDLSQFTGTNQSLAASGYQKLPGGLIIQWGTTVAIGPDNTGVAVTFPIAFTTACYSVTTAFTAYLPGGAGTQGVGSISTTSFTVFNGHDVTGSFRWIAVGK